MKYLCMVASICLVACAPSVPDEGRGHSLGHIGPTRFRVPEEALLSGMNSDVNAWLKPDVHEENSYDRPIATFDLRLWLPEVGYKGHEGQVMDGDHRLGVTVSHFDYQSNPNGPQSLLALALKGDGLYEQGEDVFGMHHWRSARFPKDTSNSDIFSSQDGKTTIICQGDALGSTPLSWGICAEWFNMPEYQSEVEMSFYREWLPAWKRVQDRVKFTVASFQVR